MSTVESIKLKIDEKAYSYAKIYAALLKEEYQRKRSYACITALYAFINLLEKTPYNLQKSMTLFRNPQLNEKYEVTDVYINNWHLDIRVLTGGGAVLVPKIHYDNNITPDYYVVIKVDSELKNAELLGFADTKDEKQEPFDYNYYSIPLNTLISYEDFLNRIKIPKSASFTEKDHEFFREAYLGFMDNSIGIYEENKLIRHLFDCPDCRTEFCCFTGFEMVSCNASKYDDLFEDKTLGIVGAQDVNDKKYEGKEEIINIENQDSEEEVSDILDELFEDTQEIIENDEQKTDTDEITELGDSDENLDLIDGSDNDVLLNSDSEGITEITDDDDLKDFDDSSAQIIEDDEIREFSESQDLEVITDDGKDLYEDNPDDLSDENTNANDDLEVFNDSDDIKIIDDENEVIRPMGACDYNETLETPENTESILEQPNTTEQKVIIDYDETGEPIYSYITSIDQEDSDDLSDTDNEFSEYPQEENTEVTDDLKDTDDIENSKILPEPASSDTDMKSEYNVEDSVEEDDLNNVTEFNTEEEYSDDNDSEISQAQIKTENDEENDNSNSEEAFEEYNDKNDDSENDEEGYEDYDEDDELEIEGSKGSNSSTRLIVLAISVLVMLGLIGGGAFFFLKNSKNNENQPSNNIKTEASSVNEQNDIIVNTQPNTDTAGFDTNVINQPAQNDSQDFFGDPNESQNNEQNPAQNENNGQDNFVPPLTENDLINQNPAPEQNNTNNNINANGDVNKAMVNSFAPSNQGVSLNGLNWFCSTELFTDNAFKNYMQNLDNILKQNLKNNLMNATEIPAQNSVTAKFAVDNNGNLIKVIISASSGSSQIDDIVLRSINETFEGEKSQILNDSPLKSDKYYLKVVIKL